MFIYIQRRGLDEKRFLSLIQLLVAIGSLILAMDKLISISKIESK